MSDRQKKIAAALGAVEAYLHDEQSALDSRDQSLDLRRAAFVHPNPWSHSGRQDMMNMRRLMQLRTFIR